MSHRQRLNYDALGVLEESVRNTPDWSKLKAATCDEFPVFVTGQMRLGKSKNDFFNGCNYYGRALTWGANYIMKRSSVWTVDGEKGAAPEPLVFQFDTDKTDWKVVGDYFKPKDMAHIEGDVYGVPLRRLAKLDLIEGNTDGITREFKYVTLLSGIQIKKDIKAYIYTVDLDLFIEAFAPNSDLLDCDKVTYMATREVPQNRDCYSV